MIVVTRSKEKENARVCAENQSNLPAHPAFKVISAKPSNTEAGMKMRRAEPVQCGVDRTRHLAAARFRETTNSGTKRLRKVNLQYQLPNRRYSA